MKRILAIMGFFATATMSLTTVSSIQADCQSCQQATTWVSDEMTAEPVPSIISGIFSESENISPTASCSGPFCGYQCRSEGVVFSVECPLLDISQEKSTDLTGQLLRFVGDDGIDIGAVDPDFDASLRVSGGWKTCDGLGFRVTYWGYDASAASRLETTMPADPDLAVHSWDTDVLDVEVTLSTAKFSGWDTTLSTGYRLFNYQETASVFQEDLTRSSVKVRYLGNGVTGSLAGRRPLVGRWNFLANARLSLLLGGEQVSASGTSLPSNVNRTEFETRFTVESQVGVEYIWPICGSGYYFVRGGGELQFWDEFAASIVPVENSHVTLGGFFLAFGLQK